MEMKLDKRVLKFHNKHNLTQNAIEQIFTSYGNCSVFRNADNKVYVKFQYYEHATMALDDIGYKMKITYANRSEIDFMNDENPNEAIVHSKERHNSDNDRQTLHEGTSAPTKSHYTIGQKNLKKPGIPTNLGYVKSGRDSQKPFMSSNSSNSRCGSFDSISTPPPLIDAKDIQKLYPVILGNLPDDYIIQDVYRLVEEYKPVAITETYFTRGKNIKFCEIYLSKVDYIPHLKRKLDGFIIGGRRLIMAQPSELLAETNCILNDAVDDK